MNRIRGAIEKIGKMPTVEFQKKAPNYVPVKDKYSRHHKTGP